MEATEYNVRLWKTENGWKVTTTHISGKSRDVTSKLRPTLYEATGIAQMFFHDCEFDETMKAPDMFGNGIPDEGLPAEPEMSEADIARDLGLPVDEITGTPEAIVDAMNASMLAGNKKRGLKVDF